MKDNSHLIAILSLDLFKFRIKQAAGRTLIVAILFQHNRLTDLDVRLGKRRRLRRRLTCRRGSTTRRYWLILGDESRIGLGSAPFREQNAESDSAGQYDNDNDER